MADDCMVTQQYIEVAYSELEPETYFTQQYIEVAYRELELKKANICIINT